MLAGRKPAPRPAVGITYGELVGTPRTAEMLLCTIFRSQIIVMKLTTSLLICLLLLGACKKEKQRTCDVYASEKGYAAGTVESYVKTPIKVVYKYSYTANGVNYTGKEKAYGIGQLDARLLGRSFVVVYKSDAPSESDLNFDYEIKEPGDLDNYISEFKTTPIKADWPRKKCE